MIARANRNGVDSFGCKWFGDHALEGRADAYVDSDACYDLVHFNVFTVDFNDDAPSLFFFYRLRRPTAQFAYESDRTEATHRTAGQNPNQIGRCGRFRPSQKISHFSEKCDRDVQADSERPRTYCFDLDARGRIFAVHNTIGRFDQIPKRKKRWTKIANVHRPALNGGAFVNQGDVGVTHMPFYPSALFGGR